MSEIAPVVPQTAGPLHYIEAIDLPDDVRQQIVHGVLSSNAFGDSTLGSEFVATEGFSLVFQRDQIAIAIEHFPYLRPVLDHALFAETNAVYVNPLVLTDNSEVHEHIDCRYVPETQTRILPTLVSVYYAEVDRAMTGGDLILLDRDGASVTLIPKTGEMVHFAGDTRHYVSKITSPVRRISIVVEQYNLSPANLAAFPECHLVLDCGDDELSRRGDLIEADRP